MIRLILLAAVLLPCAALALDLTPTRSFKELEGFKVAIFTFTDGARRVSYIPPADWKMAGGSSKLTLTPARIDDAALHLLVHRLNHGQAAARQNETEEQRRNWAKRFIPENAIEVTFVAEYPSPFLLGQKPSHEWIFHYSIGETQHAMSVARVELSDSERLAVVTTSRRVHFTEVRNQAIGSMFSWEWISPGASQPAVSAR